MNNLLEDVIHRLEKLSDYIDKMRTSGHVRDYPNLFASYVSEKIIDEIPNLERVLKDSYESSRR